MWKVVSFFLQLEAYACFWVWKHWFSVEGGVFTDLVSLGVKFDVKQHEILV